jgi:hypothetical protein
MVQLDGHTWILRVLTASALWWAADVVMQDDGARTDRFSPYYGNTGLFFVRCNDKTRHFMQVSPPLVLHLHGPLALGPRPFACFRPPTLALRLCPFYFSVS